MTEDVRANRRKELRYRLAELLRASRFEAALNEALVAYSKSEILKQDLEFVVQIVKAAEHVESEQMPPPVRANLGVLLDTSEKYLL